MDTIERGPSLEMILQYHQMTHKNWGVYSTDKSFPTIEELKEELEYEKRFQLERQKIIDNYKETTYIHTFIYKVEVI